MKIVAVKQAKNEKFDLLCCVRRDGSETRTTMPRQGILPHDLIHYVVESALLYEFGFLGLIARGADFSYAMEQAHDPGNRDLGKQAVYAEAIVESLQAQLWAGSFDAQQFLEGLRAACAARGHGVPDPAASAFAEDLYWRAIALEGQWQSVPWFGTLELDMQHV
jgi:hypothetical protein